MIAQATDAFWQKLKELDFLTPEQIQNWMAYAATENANWAELCKKIVAESVLRPAHLNQLASPSGQRVVWGNYLLLRPAYHPLGWQTYQALHAKLHKEFRLIFLPSKEISYSVGSQNERVDLLERARKVASITSNDIVKVIDIELFDDSIVAVTQLPAGKRLTEQLILEEATTNEGKHQGLSPADWTKCIESLCSDLTLIHSASVNYGGVDPLAIQIDPRTNRCRLDYLISNPVLAASETVPMDLSPEEQANIVEFRSLRSAVVATGAKTLSPQFDWRTLGVLFAHLANKLETKYSAYAKVVRSFGQQLQTGDIPSRDSIQQWLQQLSQESSVASQTDSSTEDANQVAPHAPKVGGAQKPPQRPKPTTHSRRQAKQSSEDRKKLVTMLAIVSPLPIVLVAFLIYYFGFVADAPLPHQLTAQGPVDELPDMAVSDTPETGNNNQDAATTDQKSTSPAEKKVPPKKSDSSAPEPTSSKANSSDADTDVASSDSNPETTGTTAADTTGGGDEETTAVPEANRNDQPVNELPAMQTGTGSTEDSSTDQTTSTESIDDPAESETTTEAAMDAANASSSVFTFEGLKELVDITSTFSGRLDEQAKAGNAGQPVIYALGGFNATTAKLATVQWLSADNSVSIKEIDKENFNRRWQIETGDPAIQLAQLRATADEQLELAVLPQAEENLGSFMMSKLELGYPDDKTLSKAIRFFQPRQTSKMEIGNKGAIRGVSWETPELAGQESFIKLSLSGRPLTELPPDSSLNESLNLKRGETLYFMGDTFLPGTLALVARFSPGKKTRFQGQLMLLTPQGLIKFDEPDKAAAVSEQVNLQKQQWAAQHDQIKSVRAKPGQGAAKNRQLEELEALQKAADAFLKSMELLLEKGESFYNGGVDFELRMGSENSSIVLLESGSEEEEVDSTELQTLDN